jgi:hypothetical protein
MINQYRIYLDVCCFNRPFDDQTQSRIYLEAQAVMTILSQCQTATWKLINSSAIIAELNQTPDLERLENVKKLLVIAKIKVINSPFIENRAAQLQKLGFTSYDATPLLAQKEVKQMYFSPQMTDYSKKAQKNA